MDTALIVACSSLVLAAASLGWQVATWHMDGRRVRVALLHGLVSGGGVYSGKVEARGHPRDLKPLYRQGIRGTEVIGVAVTNVGRAPVRIDRISIALAEGGMSYVPINETIGPALPHRLPPGETESWYAEADAARALVSATRAAGLRASDDVRAVVELGTGDEKRTRRTVTVGTAR